MQDRREVLQPPRPCDWCQPKPEFPNIKDGNGIFADVDVDLNQFDYPGVPICGGCGGCGGLGCQFETEDFKEQTQRITVLRFQFHPTDNLPEPPTPVIYHSLKNLVDSVKNLVQKYGSGNNDSFASAIANGKYNNALEALREINDKEIEYINNTNDSPEQKLTRPALLTLFEGNFDTGIEMLKSLAKQYHESSVVQHDAGTAILNFQRKPEEALPYFVKSTELEPKKTLHFVQTGKLLLLMERFSDSIPLFEQAQLQGDYPEFANNDRTDIPSLIEKLNQIHEQARRNKARSN